MFAAFFYLLRQRGLHVSLNEWMTLLEGMEKGLHHSTLTGFYHLCRAIVVKNETEFDHFDLIFLEFFKNVPYTGELPEDLLDWLNHPSEDLKRTIADLRSMEQRYEVATLLSEGMVYSDILERTGASSATISRVNRALLNGTGGYVSVLGKMKEDGHEQL